MTHVTHEIPRKQVGEIESLERVVEQLESDKDWLLRRNEVLNNYNEALQDQIHKLKRDRSGFLGRVFRRGSDG